MTFMQKPLQAYAVFYFLFAAASHASVGGGGPGADTTAPVVMASVDSGSYAYSQTVTLAANEAATIYYTLDGSSPSMLSQRYAFPLEIRTSSTLKFFGVDAAGNANAAQTLSFVINHQAPGETKAPEVYFRTPAKIAIRWDLPHDTPGITRYKVYRDGIERGNTPVRRYTDVGLTAATRYQYTVAACNGAGQCSSPSAPTTITTLPGAVGLWVKPQVAAGYQHSALLKSDGSLWAWGDNWQGKLGDGTSINRATPVLVGQDFVAVAAGLNHTVGLKADGTVWAWGYNAVGQIGDGTWTGRLLPVQVGAGMVAIATGGDSTFAIAQDGGLWAWGANGGTLGDGTQANRNRPAQTGSDFADVVTGQGHTAAVKSDGRLWFWGYNFYGQAGDGGTANKLIPVQLATGVNTVAAGGYHTIALKTDGSLWTWGLNSSGQLGNGSTIAVSGMVRIGDGFTRAAAGIAHTLAVKTDGSLWAWGNNNGRGQLGDGTTIDRSSPVRVGEGFLAVAAGDGHTLALKTDGSAWSWGGNFNGQLGDGTSFVIARITQQAITGATPYILPGWNLLGNGTQTMVDVSTVFGDVTRYVSVWKWQHDSRRWAIYSASLSATALDAYASSKGFDVLATINAGEGFWVNAVTPVSVVLPPGTAVTSASLATTLGSGWSLLAIGDSKTPRVFNNSLSTAPPNAGTPAAPVLTTLWAWSSEQSAWYFYAPSLDNSGGLAAYTASKSYLDFGTTTLSMGTGFWVNKP